MTKIIGRARLSTKWSSSSSFFTCKTNFKLPLFVAHKLERVVHLSNPQDRQIHAHWIFSFGTFLDTGVCSLKKKLLYLYT
jgi:hypothetical protein